MIRVNNIFTLWQLAIWTEEKINQFTGGNDEVVLLFQFAAKNAVWCCGNLKVNL